jgi:hypothetical protein
MSLDLGPEIENAIRLRAAAEGVSVNDLLARTFALERQVTNSTRDSKLHIQALLDKWQAADNTPIMPPMPTLPGETPTRALFRRWKEEDALMTDEEKDAEDRLWEDIEKGLKDNRPTFDTTRLAS